MRVMLRGVLRGVLRGAAGCASVVCCVSTCCCVVLHGYMVLRSDARMVDDGRRDMKGDGTCGAAW